MPVWETPQLDYIATNPDPLQKANPILAIPRSTATGSCSNPFPVERSYEVDVTNESCTCLDWQQRSPKGGCKHLRRGDHQSKRGRVPRTDGRLPADPNEDLINQQISQYHACVG